MAKHTIRIIDIQNITHDVKEFKLEKPEGYTFEPGQATQVAINKPGLENKGRPFSYTSLPDADHLEFIIKIYDDHSGMTQELEHLQAGDELLIGNAWGALTYRGTGTFIAGGAGVTPFIGIFRDLADKNQLEGNQLICSNKSEEDIILNDELSHLLGNRYINVLTREQSDRYEKRRIDKNYLQEQLNSYDQPFYVCGPDDFVKDLSAALKELGAKPDKVVF